MSFFTMSYSMPIGYAVDSKTGLWAKMFEHGPLWYGSHKWRNYCVPAGAMVSAGTSSARGIRQSQLVAKVMSSGEVSVTELISDDDIYSAERYRLISCIVNGSLSLMLERHSPLAWDRPACHNILAGPAPRRDH